MKVLQIAESWPEREARLLQKEDFAKFIDEALAHPSRFYDGFDPLKSNVIAVLGKPEINQTSRARQEIIKEWRYGANIVTNDGDIFYAKQAVTEVPAANEDFEAGRMELQNPAIQDTPAKTDTYTQLTTPIAASRKVFVAAPDYPLRNDADTDNTGDGVDVATYLTSYTTTDFNATGINGGAIHDNAAPVGATKLLTHFTIPAFNKTASDTLKMFVNHNMNGV
jgi:hypothetical protein